jgi:predicted tellurium resistance membrane protein TerC
MDFDWMSSPEGWIGLLTLTTLEIVLGIDNVIFLSVITARLPPERQPLARRLGLIFAATTRIGLLATIAWISRLTEPFLVVGAHPVSWRDVVLGAGGAFLLVKGTLEIHGTVEAEEERQSRPAASMAAVIVQVAILDIVFSLDSVITAVGMVNHISVMFAAIIVSTAVMLLAAGPVARFINHHPTTKMLALAFLLLVGMALIADSLHFHIPRGYLYFAIAFSAGVEVLNLWATRGRRPALAESSEAIHHPEMLASQEERRTTGAR